VLERGAVSTARFIVGNALDVLRSMDAGSADCLITSPPYHRQRAYLPDDHPDKADELGQEPTPGEFLENLLVLMDEAWRVLADHATFWVNLGDTHAGSGGAGGDYNEGGLREGQNRYSGTARKSSVVNGSDRDRPPPAGGPREQSVEWIPYLFGSSLAYGRNLLTGSQHQCWVTRPPVTWCKPSVSPGALERRFRSATELIVYGGKRQDHFFDLDAVRTEPSEGYVLAGRRKAHVRNDIPGRPDQTCNPLVEGGRINSNPAGTPPFNWWVVGHGAGFSGAHFATFPPDLIVRPVKAGCPRTVCLDCERPVARVVETVGVSQKDGERDRQDRGRLNGIDNEPPTDEEPVRRTIGWSCGCQADGARTRPGIILDPFGGTGVTALVATGHSRDAILIDIDERNVDLARQRVGMFLTEVVEASQPLERFP
jgi:hypothetical protein